MKLASPGGVEAQVELVLPPKLKASLTDSIIAFLCSGMPLGEVSGMGSNLVGNDAIPHVLPIGQTKVLFRSTGTR